MLWPFRGHKTSLTPKTPAEMSRFTTVQGKLSLQWAGYKITKLIFSKLLRRAYTRLGEGVRRCRTAGWRSRQKEPRA
jgi:hypothetical protein